MKKGPGSYFVCFTVLILIICIVPAAHSASPAGKFYFPILHGLDNPESWEAYSLRFTASEVCTVGGYNDLCGS